MGTSIKYFQRVKYKPISRWNQLKICWYFLWLKKAVFCLLFIVSHCQNGLEYKSNSDCKKEQVCNIIVSAYKINSSCLKIIINCYVHQKIFILCMKLNVQTRWEVGYPRLSGDLEVVTLTFKIVSGWPISQKM